MTPSKQKYIRKNEPAKQLHHVGNVCIQHPATLSGSYTCDPLFYYPLIKNPIDDDLGRAKVLPIDDIIIKVFKVS